MGLQEGHAELKAMKSQSDLYPVDGHLHEPGYRKDCKPNLQELSTIHISSAPIIRLQIISQAETRRLTRLGEADCQKAPERQSSCRNKTAKISSVRSSGPEMRQHQIVS